MLHILSYSCCSLHGYNATCNRKWYVAGYRLTAALLSGEHALWVSLSTRRGRMSVMGACERVRMTAPLENHCQCVPSVRRRRHRRRIAVSDVISGSQRAGVGVCVPAVACGRLSLFNASCPVPATRSDVILTARLATCGPSTRVNRSAGSPSCLDHPRCFLQDLTIHSHAARQATRYQLSVITGSKA